MGSPSPSDLLWVIGFAPQGHWIVPVVRAAVREEWPNAKHVARVQLGDETRAREFMELAIEQTHEFLASQTPVSVGEARKTLARFFRNAVRREKRAVSRLSFWGMGSDLETLIPPVESPVASLEARLDLDKILGNTSDPLRHAMLARYGARGRWSEVADELSGSKDGFRMACGRELDRLQTELGIRSRRRKTD